MNIAELVKNLKDAVPRVASIMSGKKPSLFSIPADRQRDIDLLLADAAAALEQFTWRPIESAPKDGTWILGYWGQGFLDPDISHYDVVQWRGTLDDGLWFDTTDNDLIAPSHWTPLPAPPKTE